jgi:hypothetical protein
MIDATVRDARATPEASDNYQMLKADYGALETPIYDLTRMLLAAAHLQEGDDGLRSSARLIVDLAAQKADELNDLYHRQGRALTPREQSGAGRV